MMNGKTFAERVGLLGVGDVAMGSIFTEFEKIEIRGAGPRRGHPPEVDMQKFSRLTRHICPEHHGPLALDAWPHSHGPFVRR